MAEPNLSEIRALKEKDFSEIKAKYEELFEGKVPSDNKVYLWRKIAFRLQEVEFGGLSAKAKDKLEVLIQKYEPINNVLLRPENKHAAKMKTTPMDDRRLPIPGSVITKKYHGQKIMVKVLENGFEYNGAIYKTLSSVASTITGQHWSGYTFFGYEKRDRRKQT